MGKVLAAGIFLVNNKKEVLICHPTNHPVDVWSIPKGKVEKGEEPVDAAIRETYEETNVDLTNGESFITLELQTYNHKKKAIQAYLVLETKNPSIDFNSFDFKCNSNVPEIQGGFPEMDDFMWVDFETAKKLLHPTQAISIDTIINLHI